VVEAIFCVRDSGYFLNEKLSPGLLMNLLSNGVSTEMKRAEFSDREIEVIQLLCQEKTSVEISEALFISPRTVESHRSKIFEKTKSKNVAGVVVFAVKFGIFKVG
jgi:DNA-binding CsgD family transcriptional regulator